MMFPIVQYEIAVDCSPVLSQIRNQHGRVASLLITLR